MYFGSKLQIEPSFKHAELKECNERTVDSVCDKTLRCGELNITSRKVDFRARTRDP